MSSNNGNGNGQLRLEGTVLPGCPHCGETIPEMEEQIAMIRELERDLRVKRTRVSALTSQIHGVEDKDPLFPKAQEVYAYWRQSLAPRSREFGAQARRCVLARLRAGWTTDELKMAVDGCVSCPYWTRTGRRPHGQPEQRRVELEMICKDDTMVRGFVEIYERNKDKDASVLAGGGTNEKARLCDCGHSMWEHLPFFIAVKFDLDPKLTHEPCAAKDCECMAFDTIDQQIAEWQEREKRARK